ncbi:MAG: response regulator [Kiloniellales bacterium]
MRGTIFIVDDTPTDQELMSKSLSKSGFHTLKFSNAHDALLELDKVKPVAVVTDVLMPKMDGIEFIRLMRQKMYKGLIVAVSSGGVFNNLDSIKYAVVSGADFGLKKPIDFARIGSIIISELDGLQSTNRALSD